VWDGGHRCRPVRPRNVEFFGRGGGAEASSRSGSAFTALQPTDVLNERSLRSDSFYIRSVTSLLSSSTRGPSHCWEWRGADASPRCHSSALIPTQKLDYNDIVAANQKIRHRLQQTSATGYNFELVNPHPTVFIYYLFVVLKDWARRVSGRICKI
jgi:hypothetical protein